MEQPMRPCTAPGNSRKSLRLDPTHTTGFKDGSSVIGAHQYSDFTISRRRSASSLSQELAHLLNGPLCKDVYRRAKVMTETLSIRIDSETKKRLNALSKRSKRSKSFLAADAIAAYVESEQC